jgi:hypothetical protein
MKNDGSLREVESLDEPEFGGGSIADEDARRRRS